MPLLDKKGNKSMGSVILAMMNEKKGPSVSKDKLSRGGDGELDVEEEDVGVDDQMKVCANRLMRAVKEDNADLFAKSFVDMLEAAQMKLEDGGQESEDYLSD